MKIPESFEFLGLPWSVEETDLENDGGKYGLTNFKAGKIKIEASLLPDMKAQTLLHEYLHVVFYHMGLTANGEPLRDEEYEERVVDTIANGLYAILKATGSLK